MEWPTWDTLGHTKRECSAGESPEASEGHHPCATSPHLCSFQKTLVDSGLTRGEAKQKGKGRHTAQGGGLSVEQASSRARLSTLCGGPYLPQHAC